MTDRKIDRVISEPVLALVGPTAIGKTALSLDLARQFNCEIVSVDSMQVYRFMDIGTAKATMAERRVTPHHLIDIVDPDQEYNAAQFARDAREVIEAIHRRGAVPLLTGGTGLYLRALRDGLFGEAPANLEIRTDLRRRAAAEGVSVLHEELMSCDRISADIIHPHDSARIIRALEVYRVTGIPLSDHIRQQRADDDTPAFARLLTIGLSCDRTWLYDRINRRTELMLAGGLETEVRGLLDRGYHPNLKSMQSIGYRHMLHYISGEWSASETREWLARDTRRYAKRQLTWFTGDRRITWFDRDGREEIVTTIDAWLKG